MSKKELILRKRAAAADWLARMHGQREVVYAAFDSKTKEEVENKVYKSYLSEFTDRSNAAEKKDFNNVLRRTSLSYYKHLD